MLWVILIAVVIYVSYELGKTSKEQSINAENEYKKAVEQNRLRKQVLADYVPIAGTKRKPILENIISNIYNNFSSFDYEIEPFNEDYKLLAEYLLYIKTNNSEDEIEIRNIVDTLIPEHNKSELIAWIIPPKNEVNDYPVIGGSMDYIIAYYDKEVLRRFLKVESYVIKTNYTYPSSWIQWDVVINPKYNKEELKKIYDENFWGWEKELRKIDPSLKIIKPKKKYKYMHQKK